MNAAKIIAALVFVCFVFPTGGCASAQISEATAHFHPPETEAERVLDRIFRLYDQNSDLDGFIFSRPQREQERDKNFKPLFTENFLKEAREKHKERVKESCSGAYPKDGLECDFIDGVNPIYCANDRPAALFFHTVSLSDNTITISYPSPQKEKEAPTYKMVKTATGWKLDGIDCKDGKTTINANQCFNRSHVMTGVCFGNDR